MTIETPTELAALVLRHQVPSFKAQGWCTTIELLEALPHITERTLRYMLERLNPRDDRGHGYMLVWSVRGQRCAAAFAAARAIVTDENALRLAAFAAESERGDWLMIDHETHKRMRAASAQDCAAHIGTRGAYIYQVPTTERTDP